MLDKNNILSVVQANLFEPVNDANREATRQRIASGLNLGPDKVLLGREAITIIDDQEVHQVQIGTDGQAVLLGNAIDRALGFLNDLFNCDPIAIWLACCNRIPISERVSRENVMQPVSHVRADGTSYSLSGLDLVNGVLAAMTGRYLEIDFVKPEEGRPPTAMKGFKIHREALQSSEPAANLGGESHTD
jgi:hypothetical protein